ncbi:hypothetical protein ACIQB5_49270, partial [Streptomyces sp. NPDC088560]|uniref:hypothetical protein n=1 Tax=Streptomyces sp. NPDC088560 TaxID=3365868 RepID=UPI003802FA43
MPRLTEEQAALYLQEYCNICWTGDPIFMKEFSASKKLAESWLPSVISGVVHFGAYERLSVRDKLICLSMSLFHPVYSQVRRVWMAATVLPMRLVEQRAC